MTKKDYELIAEQFYKAVFKLKFEATECQSTLITLHEIKDIVANLSSKFGLDNPRYDDQRFYDACGL